MQQQPSKPYRKLRNGLLGPCATSPATARFSRACAKVVLVDLLIPVLVATLCASCRPAADEARFEGFVEDVRQTALDIDGELGVIRKEVQSLARFTVGLYEPATVAANLAKASPTAYALTSHGVLYKPSDDGGSAVFVSGAVPVDERLRRIVQFTEPLDGEFRRIVTEFPAVVQAYYNDRNSYNRIYPFFDVVSQYEPGIDIPQYNFYYLADAEHNPARSGVWVGTPYVDPAGRGWMVSAIAPVYVGGRLEGVPGLDITVGAITKRYIGDRNRDLALLAADGTIVAIADRLAVVLSLPPLKNHEYLQTIRMDTFRSDDYNLLRSRTRAVRELAEAVLDRRERSAVLVKEGRRHRFAAATVTEVNWVLLGLCPE